MMKKFLVILAVMAVAPLATAGLMIELDQNDVLPGTVVTATVVQDAGNVAGSGGEMTIAVDAEISSTADLTAGFAEGGTWLWGFNGGIAIADGDVWFAKVPTPGFGTPGVGSTSATGAAYEGTVAFTIVAPDQMGDYDLVWGGVWDGEDMTGAIGATLTVVPEPITIGLLGLGGLFIRRRK
jgi:hypothetical protein